MVSLSSEAYKKLSELKDLYALAFDVAYQCRIAEEKGLTIFTMGNDFRRAKNVKVKFI